MFDLIVSDFLTKNNLKKYFTLLSDKGTLWVKSSKENILNEFNLIKESEFLNHLENWLVINTQNETSNYYHLTKSKNYIWNQIEIKRDVVVPYVLKSENGQSVKRGWEYENGKAKRWTGIGNCLYVSDKNYINQIFMLLSSNENSEVLYNDKNIYRNYDTLYNQISTSENCKLSFSNRLFLPKNR